eukprot:749882_1
MAYLKDGTLWYDGEWINGKRNGKGTSYYPNGRKRYIGDFKNNKYHGEGAFYRDDDNLYYDGHWANSTMNDKGTLYYDDNGNKMRYTGQFLNGKVASSFHYYIGYLFY